MRVKGGDGGVEGTAVVGVQKSGAVWADQGAAHTVDVIDNLFLKPCALFVLFGKSGRYDNEAAGVLLVGQHIHRCGAVFGCNGQNGAVHLGKLLHLGVAADALHFGLFRIDGIDLAFKAALLQIL